MNKLESVIIEASAGTGKTFQLVARMISLLHSHNADPSSIIALTFSRKAAREIADRLFNALLENKAGYINEDERIKTLRKLVASLHKLQIGTIDSFLFKMLSMFNNELGLAEDLTIIEEDSYDFSRIQNDILKQMFLEKEKGDPTSNTLWQNFRAATFGKEGKSIHEQIDRWISSGHRLIRELPDIKKWGNSQNIFGKDITSDAEFLNASEVERIVKAICPQLEHQKLPEQQIKQIAAIKLSSYESIKNALETLILKKILLDSSFPQKGIVHFNYRNRKKPYELNNIDEQDIKRLKEILFGIAIKFVLEATQGVAAILAKYNEEYEKYVRGKNILSFKDIQYFISSLKDSLLKDKENKKASIKALIKSVEFRLDSSINHWLIDEFQDTSLDQWNAIKELVDEALQDNTDSKSFFCVGDKKQSIYGWRGGCPELINIIKKRGKFKEEQLTKSYRTAKEIVNFVNALFDRKKNTKDTKGEDYPDWMKDWQEYKTNRDTEGYVQIELVKSNKNEENKDDKAITIAQKCVDVLKPILNYSNHSNKVPSIAILVRDNKQVDRLAREIKNLLKKQNSPYINSIVAKSDKSIAEDNFILPLIISLLTLIKHPNDSGAISHIKMSPLATWFAEKYNNSGYNFADIYQTKLARTGIWEVINEWLMLCHKNNETLSAHTIARINNLKEALANFEKTGETDIDDLIGTLQKTLPSIIDTPKNCILISTIHAVKGLEFDAVILPILKEQQKSLKGGTLYLHRDGKNQLTPQWGLMLPPKEIREYNKTLENTVLEYEKKNFHEELNLLYVAITRARDALYILLEDQASEEKKEKDKKNSETELSINSFVKEYYASQKGQQKEAEIISVGNSKWFEGLQKSEDTLKEDSLPELPPCTFQSKRLQKKEPSKEGKETSHILTLFERNQKEALDYGTFIHKLLSEIEWLNEQNEKEFLTYVEKKLRNFGAVSDETIFNAKEHLKQLFSANETRHIFLKSQHPRCIVWREKSFCFIEEQTLISGIFDRVHLYQDENNKIKEAIIYDFKTDKVEDGTRLEEKIEERKMGYKKQLLLYKKALLKIVGEDIPVRTFLAFTQYCKVIEVN